MRRTTRRNRLLAAALVVAGAAVCVGLTPVEPTDAAWQRSHNQRVALTAGTLAAVPTVSCVAPSGGLSASVPIRWTAPTTGLAPTGYTVSWTNPGGTTSTPTGSTATTANLGGGVLSVAGQSVVTVYATSGSWTSPVSTQSVRITTLSLLGAILSWECRQN